ncbi:MAG: hypothetical protein ACRDQA_17420, partial [Nocardioidaceae bacterium]
AQAHVRWMPGSLREVLNAGPGFYTYAPSVIASPGRQLIWTCHNRQPYVIRDHIYLSQVVGHKVRRNTVALGPDAADTWDSFHICDPSVVAGRFHYRGRPYRYALFFLGNDVNASANNQVGVAFSNSLYGGWVRYPDPIVSYPNTGAWGVGQPSAVSLDRAGRVLLFYTHGASDGTYGARRVLDLRDMSHPRIGPEAKVPTAGLTRTDGKQDLLNNFDVAYDPSRARFYAIRAQHPNPTDNPRYIVSSVQLVSIPARAIWTGHGTWRAEGAITPGLTGLPRNHNAGLVRTLYGWLPSRHAVTVAFTSSCAASSCPSTGPLYTYHLWEVTGHLSN